MITLVFDTETTGLPLPKVADLKKQPKIIELAVARIDSGKVVSEHTWLINPQEPLTAEINKITKLHDSDLADKPTFAQVLPEIVDAFTGADVLIAHNAEFDVSMLTFDLRRCEAHKVFPWPKTTLCTVQEFVHEFGRRPRLIELYKRKIGRELQQTHRALDDVRALVEIVLATGLA